LGGCYGGGRMTSQDKGGTKPCAKGERTWPHDWAGARRGGGGGLEQQTGGGETRGHNFFLINRGRRPKGPTPTVSPQNNKFQPERTPGSTRASRTPIPPELIEFPGSGPHLPRHRNRGGWQGRCRHLTAWLAKAGASEPHGRGGKKFGRGEASGSMRFRARSGKTNFGEIACTRALSFRCDANRRPTAQ